MSFKSKSERYLSQYNQERIYVGKSIPKKQLDTAKEYYFIEEDEIFFLVDSTILGTCKTGVAFGTKGIYWNNDWTNTTENQFISWEDLLFDQDEITQKKFGALSLSSVDNIGLTGSYLRVNQLHRIIIDILNIYTESLNNEDDDIGDIDSQGNNKSRKIEPRYIPASDETFYIPIESMTIREAINVFPEYLKKELGYFESYLEEVQGVKTEDEEVPLVILLLQWFVDSFNHQEKIANLTHISTGASKDWWFMYSETIIRIIIVKHGELTAYDRELNMKYMKGLTAFAICQLDPIKLVALAMPNHFSYMVDEYNKRKVLVKNYAFFIREVNYLYDYNENRIGPRMYYDYLTASSPTRDEDAHSKELQNEIGDFVFY